MCAENLILGPVGRHHTHIVLCFCAQGVLKISDQYCCCGVDGEDGASLGCGDAKNNNGRMATRALTHTFMVMR